MAGSKSKPGGFLTTVERIGNKLPDPAVLFIALLFVVWVLSWLLSYVTFEVVDPRSGKALVIENLLAGSALTEFLSVMVTNFSHFHPVGVVLVAMLGIGVAEHTGFINSALRSLLNVTSDQLLTPMVIVVGIVSHTAADAGYVLVIPLGGVIFYAAGRHPLAGIAAAFAGVSGGFSASFVPSSIDPLLQGLTQAGAQILDSNIVINPLNNYFFTTASSLLIVGLGWYITDKIIEPRLRGTKLDGDESDPSAEDPIEEGDGAPEEQVAADADSDDPNADREPSDAEKVADIEWQDRVHFYAVASRLMRRVLVDHARAHRSAKRGAGLPKLNLNEALKVAAEEPWDMLDLDLALERLGEQDSRKARVVELHYFGGLKFEDIAKLLEITHDAVAWDVRMAKAWLRRELQAS